MGAWGVGHFDNDDAGDWVWELEEAKSLAPVEAALAAVEGSADYLEAPDAAIGLAAAEAVAASLGKPAPDLPDSVADVVSKLEAPAGPELAARLRTAVERIAADSELRELWEETDDFAKWQSRTADLLQRLK
ncbi:MAG: DUF4259 domain-containing protein [Pseudomonadota bacterium]